MYFKNQNVIYSCTTILSWFCIAVEGEKIAKVTIVGQEKILLKNGSVVASCDKKCFDSKLMKSNLIFFPPI